MGYDLEMSDALYIVERYQERAFDSNPAMGTMAVFAGNIESLRQLLDIANNAFDISTRYTPDKDNVQLTSLEGQDPCSQEGIFNDLGGQTNEEDKEGMDLLEDSISKNIPEEPEEKDRSVLKCFECAEAPTLDMQWPVFGLEGLENLLNAINDCIDNLMKQLDPYNFLNGLCPFLDKFAQAQCELDLRALIALLNMLISRYSLSALKLSLNWGVVLGPIIKAIVDFIANAIEYVIAYISYIFECLRNALRVIKKLFDEAQQLLQLSEDLINQAQDSAASLFDGDSYGFVKEPSANYSKGRGGEQFGEEFNTLKENTVNQFGNKSGAARTDDISYDFGSFGRKTHKGKIKGVGEGFMGLLDPNGIAFEYRPTLENMFDADTREYKEKQNENWVNRGMGAAKGAFGRVNDFISKLEAILNSGEDYIKELFASFLFSLKSLNSAINSNIELNIKIGGIILMLWDMINLMVALIQTDFGNLCEDTDEGDFVLFDQLMKALYGGENLSYQNINGRVAIDSGIYNLDVVKCGLDLEATYTFGAEDNE